MIRFALALGLLLSFCSIAQAQDRLPPIPAEKLTDAQKKAAAEYMAARGPLTGPWNVLLRSPDLINRQRGVSDYVRFNSVLSPKLSEFIILITARHWAQQYVWNAHHPAVSDQLGAQQLLPIDLLAAVGSHEGPPLPDVGDLHKGGQAPRPGLAQPNGAAPGILGVDLEGNPGLVVDSDADMPRAPVELRPDQQQDPDRSQDAGDDNDRAQPRVGLGRGPPQPQTHRWFLSDRLCHLVPTTTAAAAAAQAAWSCAATCR